jgi:GntR family transcriptional regulator/MocR family aminotransferase
LTSRTIELLITLTRGGTLTLGAQIEGQIRDTVRAGRLRPGAPLPSTRDLAHQLGVSRPVVMEAYAQLAEEGYLTLRQGARARVSVLASRAAPVKRPGLEDVASPSPPLFDFRTSVPDLSSFPRQRWLNAARTALGKMSGEHFGYSEQHGSEVLRRALADYLGRVRGVVVAELALVIVTIGFAQGRALAVRALSAMGAKRIAVEDPSYTEWAAVRRAGLEIIPIPVDAGGMRVDELERIDADAVMLTPAHQYPTGAVLTGERRLHLLQWLRRRNAIAIEDDYDSEFRYDRPQIRALQGLDPDRVVYAGTTSKTLAPALRIGWLVVPNRLLKAVQAEQRLLDFGCPRIEQHTLAEFIASGELDKHLRRMRVRYRARRDSLVAAVAAELPGASVEGIAAGMHAMIRLPSGSDEGVIRKEAHNRGVALEFLSDHCVFSRSGHPSLLLGYARMSETNLQSGVRALSAAVRAARRKN